MGSPFSFVCSWCCCFNTDADNSDGHSKDSLADRAHNSTQAKDVGRPTPSDASNGQMQPTLPPLPELRPLEPLEPNFEDLKTSVDPGTSSNGTTLKGREEEDGSALQS